MNKKQLMVQIALDLFAREGYENTGIAAIVEAAEVTKPTLYHYFGSKEGLLRTIFEERFVRFMAELKKIKIENQPVMTVMEQYIHLYILEAQQEPLFFWLVNHLRKAPLDSVVHTIVKPYYDLEIIVIRELIVHISDQHPNLLDEEDFLIMNFLSIVNGFIEVNILKKTLDEISPEASIKLAKQLLYGIYAL